MKSLTIAKSTLCLVLVACGGNSIDLGGPPDGGQAGKTGSAGSTGTGMTTGTNTTTNGQGGGMQTTGNGAAGDRPNTTGGVGGMAGKGTGGSGAGGTPITDAGMFCGGFSGATCPANMFCDYPTGAMCGATDRGGICQPRPQACTADCPGVCGCDGKFYCNACNAHSVGVDDADDKSCLVNKPDGGQQVCGSIAGLTCTADKYCKYNPGEACGLVSDGGGVCLPRPQVCPQNFAPVCACDGKTYNNSCYAASAGQDVAGTPNLCHD